MTNPLADPPTRRPATKSTWTIRIALVLAVLITITAGVLGYLGACRATDQAATAQRAATLAEVMVPTVDLAAALSLERDGASAGLPPVVTRPLQERTDLGAEAWRGGVRDIDRGEDEELDATLDQIDRALADIDDLRTQAREPGEEAQQRYTELVTDLLTQGTTTERAVGVPAQQIVNQVIAESGADSSAVAPDVYVMSSMEFMRGLQDVLAAAVQEIVEDLRVEREEETRAALTAVVFTVAAPRPPLEYADRVRACPTSINGSALSKWISSLGEACWSPSPGEQTARSSWRPRPER